MICQLTARNYPQFLQFTLNVPALGVLMQVNSELYLEKPALMQFFLCEEGALMIKGSNATLAGRADQEELASMLEFLGICSLTSQETVPQGWGVESTTSVMEFLPQTPAPQLPKIEICHEPSAADILQLVAFQGIIGDAADNFYSELCTKRNHQKAVIWTAQIQGKPVCTAGAYALTDTEAYLAGVVTHPDFRRQKLASALCFALASHLYESGRRVFLRCDPALQPFYRSFGFSTIQTLLNTKKEQP